jgi:hypothetical protein
MAGRSAGHIEGHDDPALDAALECELTEAAEWLRSQREREAKVATDLYVTGHDFLTTPPPPDCYSLITNPPFKPLDDS